MPDQIKNKPRFMTGYNAGSRHEKLGYVPKDFSFEGLSADFLAGYRFGVADRKAGHLTDNDAATRRIDGAWHLYQQGGVIVEGSITKLL